MIRIDFEGRLDEDTLAEIIENFWMEKVPVFQEDSEYMQGRNVEILNRINPSAKSASEGAPDERIPVAYARKIVNTVSGYMYKPGLITVNEGEADPSYFEKVHEILEVNNFDVKANKAGKAQAANGVGYIMVYLSIDGFEITPEQESANIVPRFEKVDPETIIPIMNMDIEPKLKAFIRLVKFSEDNIKAHVYYDNEILYYNIKKKSGKTDIVLTLYKRLQNFFKKPPLVIIQNNEEFLSDWRIVKDLIDSYDFLGSDSMNEFLRFAWAYLVITGASIDDDEAKDIKAKRIIELLDKEGSADFLTKNMQTDFIEFMERYVRRQIHNQTMIPDIEDISFSGAQSGVSIEKFIYLIEYIATEKEAYFKNAMYELFELINNILLLSGGGGDYERLEIVMNRNLPQSDLKNAEVYDKLHGKGFTDETLMKNFAPFVKDPEAEVEAANEQAEDRMPDFMEPEVDEEEDDEE